MAYVVRKLLGKTLECWQTGINELDVHPGLICQPIIVWVRHVVHNACGPCQEKPVFKFIHLVLGPQQRHAQREREHQLVLLKQTAAHVVVEGKCEIFNQVVQPVLKLLVWFCKVTGSQEEVEEPLHTVLVHRVYHCQAGCAKEEDRAVEGYRAVLAAGLVDDDLCLLCFCLLLINERRLLLAALQCHNQVFLLQDVPLSLLQHSQDGVLQVLQLLGHCCVVGCQCLLLILQVLALLTNNFPQQLVLQPLGGDEEVQ
mmetsp:Transcript_3423/g.5891  ORF Transcript_3423/g.5891 Transcript_3423/m.5891 type:complete len:256 (-) Transcript_3423:9644-10411(-)